MSFKLQKTDLTRQQILKIKNDLFVEGVESEYGPAETIEAYTETANSIYIPLNYCYNQKLLNQKENSWVGMQPSEFKFDFKNDDQKQVYNTSLEQLNKTGNSFLSLSTNFGKTFLGIKLAHSLKLKTAVLIHRKILADQWVESIQKFTSAKVQVVGTSDPLNPEADYYIFNIAYVPKTWNSELKKWEPKKLGNKEYLNIGTLIVDEAHIACASEMCKALFHFQPKYSIALTATPKRADGLDKLLDLYFGEDKIIKISQTPFIVYRYPTKIKPVYTKNARGKKDWNSVVEYLVTSKKRNQMIIDITQQFKHKTIMIMSKRVDHCKIITELLNEIGESVTMMKGTDKTYDKTARILVSTFSKLGVGFDDQRLDLLILTCSVKEVEQYAGRLRHTEGKERIIVDLVDDDCNCNSHWLTRRKWYLSRKGEIRNYSVNEVSGSECKNEVNGSECKSEVNGSEVVSEATEPEKPRKRFAPVLKK